MSYLMEEILSQGKEKMISTLQNSLYPGEPCILIGKEEVKSDCTYKRFCIDDLFTDLFCKTKDNPPLVESIIFPKDKKERLEFLLPPDMLDKIKGHKKKDGKPYIVEEGNNNDYMWFFRPSGDNKKIINLIHEMFTEKGGKEFVLEVQKHIINSFSLVDFSGNSKIIEYLASVGDKIIVPKQESVPANEAFHALLDAGTHSSVSLIIANFLISALLGLRPVQYDSVGKLFYKTYLLNGLGMEYIWNPNLICTPYEELHSIWQNFKKGDYKTVYHRIVKWISDYENSATQKNLTSAYQILGTCLCRHPEKCNLGDSVAVSKTTLKNRQAEGAAYLEKCLSAVEDSPEVHFILYEYYSGGDSEKAAAHLMEAVKAKHAQAIIAYVTLFAKNPASSGAITDEEKYQRLNDIITNDEKNYSENEVSSCLYLRGQLHQRNGNEKAAEADFIEAAKRGHEKSRQEISRKKRMEQNSLPTFTDDPDVPCCFANSLTGNNYVFVSSLPNGKWSLYTTGESNSLGVNAITVRDMNTFIKMRYLNDPEWLRSRIIFLFMSEDEKKNLNESLILLDQLFNIALNAPEAHKHRMIDSIDIYVGAKYETASMLIDASVSDMGSDIYFKVHIADETRDAIHRLLCDAPLFLPHLNRAKCESATNIVLFGCTDTNYRFIKESIACAYLGESYPIAITVLGADADRMESKLRQECPGLYHELHIACIRPTFIPCCIEETDFPNYIYGSKHDDNPDDAIVKALSDGNYFVVDLSNDSDSINFSMELRTWLLRSRGTFDRTPFIAFKCSDSRNSYLADRLTLSGQVAGTSYYNKYDLFPFGIAKEMYSYHRLIENPRLEEVSLLIHKSYYGDDNERQAENDYYSFSYNADSSLLTAIGLSYRLFAGGAFFSHKEEYLQFGAYNSQDLLASYSSSERAKDIAAALEQSRWNGYMLSRGWESANSIQVQAYKNQSTGSSHKHALAKLHPFIREWEDLDDNDLKRILGILKAKFDYDRHPQTTTRKSIEDTEKFLNTPIKDGEKVY